MACCYDTLSRSGLRGDYSSAAHYTREQYNEVLCGIEPDPEV